MDLIVFAGNERKVHYQIRLLEMKRTVSNSKRIREGLRSLEEIMPSIISNTDVYETDSFFIPCSWVNMWMCKRSWQIWLTYPLSASVFYMLSSSKATEKHTLYLMSEISSGSFACWKYIWLSRCCRMNTSANHLFDCLVDCWTNQPSSTARQLSLSWQTSKNFNKNL